MRTFALIYGMGFLLVGLAGFVPGLVQPIPLDAPSLVVDQGYGLIFGLFPVNVLHNLVHLLFGVIGLAAYGGYLGIRLFAQIVAVAYGLLVILGLLPATSTTFGLVPIYGADVWLHLVVAIPAFYFGFLARPAIVSQL